MKRLIYSVVVSWAQSLLSFTATFTVSSTWCSDPLLTPPLSSSVSQPAASLTLSRIPPSLQVVLGIQCELRRQLRSFISLERLPLVSEPVGSACHRPARPPPFTSRPSLLGPSIRLAVSRGRVSAEVIGVASEDSRRLAAVLNGAVHLSGLSFTLGGCDTHHFLQSRPVEEDLALGLGAGGRVLLEGGVNVSVSQMSAVVGGRTRRFADITLQQGALCLCVRYGGSEEEERARVREEARRRAVRGRGSASGGGWSWARPAAAPGATASGSSCWPRDTCAATTATTRCPWSSSPSCPTAPPTFTL